MSKSIAIFLLFSLFAMSVMAAGEAAKSDRITSFYLNKRAELLSSLSNARSVSPYDILHVDFQAFEETFGKLSAIGGKEYEQILREELESRKSRRRDSKAFEKFERKYERLFGRAENEAIRQLLGVLISGHLGFRFIEASVEDADEAEVEKLLFTATLRPMITSIIRRLPRSSNYRKIM